LEGIGDFAMPKRTETTSVALDILDSSLAKYGNSLDKAWLGIYETLLWYVPVGGGKGLPHIIDANNLRPSVRGKGSKKWVQRANKFNDYLAKEMDVSPDEVPAHVDKLMNHKRFIGMQRQNHLGIAFIGTIKHLIERFGDHSLRSEMEADATSIFPEHPLYGRTSKPRIDLIFKRGNKIVSISSFKWSIRHDRLNDVTGECETYKKACSQLYGSTPKFFSITNEFSPSRLQKLIEHPCIDSVVHIHKEAVADICELNGRLVELIDLVDFVKSSFEW